MNKELATITDFNLSKSQINAFARNVLAELDEGFYNPLEIHICLKAMEELVKKLKEGIANEAISEAEKYGEKEFDYKGSKVILANRRTYDYSQDATWSSLDEEKRKRETMLKNISEPMADPNTGELIYPAAFKVTPSISITLPK